MNPRPQAWEACTLPTELHPLVIQTHIKNEIENVKNFEKLWIFYISAGEFCDAALKALLSLQRQAVIVFGDSFRNSGWHENITTAKNENIVGIKDGVAVLVKVYKLAACILYEISRVEVIT